MSEHDDNAFFTAWKLYIHHHRQFNEWFNKKFPVQAQIINDFLEKEENKNNKPDDDADWWETIMYFDTYMVNRCEVCGKFFKHNSMDEYLVQRLYGRMSSLLHRT